jgi:hypothetical protein
MDQVTSFFSACKRSSIEINITISNMEAFSFFLLKATYCDTKVHHHKPAANNLVNQHTVHLQQHQGSEQPRQENTVEPIEILINALTSKNCRFIQLVLPVQATIIDK